MLTEPTTRTAPSRLRRLAFAGLLGAATVVWPGGPGFQHALTHQPPPFERALSWSDIIRLRLSPWLLDSAEDDSAA